MNKKVNKVFYIIVHILEYVIATLTLAVLVGTLIFEIAKLFTSESCFETTDIFLHNVLTLVVGLEFVRMLINLTPANTIEVLIVAIARQVIINHNDPLPNIACVVCIAGLFATRKFLISKRDLKKELSEGDCEPSPEEVGKEKQPIDTATDESQSQT